MKKTARISSIFLSLFILILLAVVAYGEEHLPNLISTCADEVRFNFLFSVKNTDILTASARSNADTGHEEATIKLFDTIPVKKVVINKTDRRYVAVGGELIGVTLQTDGIVIVGTEKFYNDNSSTSPATEAGLKIGDIIINVNGHSIKSNAEFINLIENSEGKALEIEYKRNEKVMKTTLIPKLSDLTLKYKCGLWIRDCTNGIGTLTYTDIENGTIASLGHGIYDVDTKTILPVAGGEFRSAVLLGITKGNSGAAGEIKGMIGEKNFGELKINCESGIYGKLLNTPNADNIIPVASRDEIKCGSAKIISMLENGKKETFDIEIEKIDYSTDKTTKNMIIKVTDDKLLEKTGGIIQGMSGSPIIQNDMFVGAVTHVFLNDPERGYAIFAENMLALSDSLSLSPAA